MGRNGWLEITDSACSHDSRSVNFDGTMCSRASTVVWYANDTGTLPQKNIDNLEYLHKNNFYDYTVYFVTIMEPIWFGWQTHNVLVSLTFIALQLRHLIRVMSTKITQIICIFRDESHWMYWILEHVVVSENAVFLLLQYMVF